MKHRIFTPAVLAALLLPLGLARAQTTAVAVITPTAGNQVSGTVVFTATESGVHVVADLDGLPPGPHGFHIHEYGDIRDQAKGLATGGHFDPAGTKHHALVGEGAAGGGAHHAGDMGNVTADAGGHGHVEMDLPGVTLGGAHGILGRGVIVHAKPDDGGQPTGNAGGRIGQGVIGVAKG